MTAERTDHEGGFACVGLHELFGRSSITFNLALQRGKESNHVDVLLGAGLPGNPVCPTFFCPGLFLLAK